MTHYHNPEFPESSHEGGDGRTDWRAAHAAQDDRDSTAYIPETCRKCRHIQIAIEEEALTPADAKARLELEGFTSGF